MKNCFSFSLILILSASSAAIACPNFTGSYNLDSASSPRRYVISQKDCQEVSVSIVDGQNGTVVSSETFITDGKVHVWDEDSGADVGVTFTMKSAFVGNTVVGHLGMSTLPGQELDTRKLSLDTTGKIFTYSATSDKETLVYTATKTTLGKECEGDAKDFVRADQTKAILTNTELDKVSGWVYTFLFEKNTVKVTCVLTEDPEDSVCSCFN